MLFILIILATIALVCMVSITYDYYQFNHIRPGDYVYIGGTFDITTDSYNRKEVCRVTHVFKNDVDTYKHWETIYIIADGEEIRIGDYLKRGMERIRGNFDDINEIIVAKEWNNVKSDPEGDEYYESKIDGRIYGLHGPIIVSGIPYPVIKVDEYVSIEFCEPMHIRNIGYFTGEDRKWYTGICLRDLDALRKIYTNH